MKLEYIIIFKEEGVPIYSQCYGSFCARVAFDESLYSGFLSALTSMPSMFGDETGLQSVEMGFTKLHFSKTTPSGHIICIGIDKATSDDIDMENQLEGFYNRVNTIVEDQYKDFDWVQTKQSDIDDFEELLVHEAIYPSFPYFDNSEICKDECPFDHDANIIDPETDQPISIVERFKRNYSKAKSIFKRIFGPFYVRIYRWFDLRSYQKSRESGKINKVNQSLEKKNN